MDPKNKETKSNIIKLDKSQTKKDGYILLYVILIDWKGVIKGEIDIVFMHQIEFGYWSHDPAVHLIL